MTPMMKTVLTWTNVKGGNAPCQWFGFHSDSYEGKTFNFNGWIKFVGQIPPMSEEFGLKVCGRFYNSFISKCAANKWCEISETVYCNGGDRNYIVLIFDTVATKGQVVKMHSVTLNGLVGKKEMFKDTLIIFIFFIHL